MNEPANFGTNDERPWNWPETERPYWSLKCPTGNLDDPPYRTSECLSFMHTHSSFVCCEYFVRLLLCSASRLAILCQPRSDSSVSFFQSESTQIYVRPIAWVVFLVVNTIDYSKKNLKIHTGVPSPPFPAPKCVWRPGSARTRCGS